MPLSFFVLSVNLLSYFCYSSVILFQYLFKSFLAYHVEGRWPFSVPHICARTSHFLQNLKKNIKALGSILSLFTQLVKNFHGEPHTEIMDGVKKKL